MERPPIEIVDVLARLTKVEHVAFEKLKGGRTNSVWKATTENQSFVCKSFEKSQDNGIFPNSPSDEIKALEHLDQFQVAPQLRAFEITGETGVVIYDYLDGDVWVKNTKPVGKLLRKLHSIAPPNGLRCVASGSKAILAQSDQLAQQLNPAAIVDLAGLRPSLVVPPVAQFCFLHGDPVPGNLVVNDDAAKFIDWQCPAVGDPAEDLAVFLSPAMQVLYRGSVASEQETENLKMAYGHPNVFERFNTLRPYFHYRMALYCLWKYQNGHADYRAVAELEITALEQLS